MFLNTKKLGRLLVLPRPVSALKPVHFRASNENAQAAQGGTVGCPGVWTHAKARSARFKAMLFRVVLHRISRSELKASKASREARVCPWENLENMF